MAFPTYVSPVAQTIRTVNHLDGITATYAFSAGGTYVPLTQEEAWIFIYLASAYGLQVSRFGFGSYSEGTYGAGAFGD